MSQSIEASGTSLWRVRLVNGFAAAFALFATVLWAGRTAETYATEGMGLGVAIATFCTLIFVMGTVGAGRDCYRGRW